MEAIEMTIPAPAQHGRSTRIAAIAMTVTAIVLAIAGTIALAANVLRDGDGLTLSVWAARPSTARSALRSGRAKLA